MSRESQKGRSFKKGLDVNTSRKKREELSLRIRKNKRQEGLQKRRHVSTTKHEGDDPQEEEELLDLQRIFPEIISGIRSPDPDLWLEATSKLRQLLCQEGDDLPIQTVVDSGVVPCLVNFLTSDDPELVFQAAWVLTNIASGSSHHTQVVLEANAVPIFISLLDSKNDEIQEQAAWALGNIAGDRYEFRDYIIQCSGLPAICQALLTTTKNSLASTMTWALSNFCRGKPSPSWEAIRSILPTFSRLLHSSDSAILTDACWALSYITEGTDEQIQAVVNSGVVKRLIELLIHPSSSVQAAALRTIGNIVTGDDNQTQVVLNSGVLQRLGMLLTRPKKSVRKECCWVISNITAGNKNQIAAVRECHLIKPLIHLISTDSFEVRREALWAVANALMGGSPQDIKQIVQDGCISAFCQLLTDTTDSSILELVLDSLSVILKFGEDTSQESGFNEYSNFIEEIEGADKIEKLLYHDNNDISNKATHLIQTYFNFSEEENVDNNVSGNFQFSASTGPIQTFKF
eukprot:TRINITY_DN1605_c0_g1_i1.p1 TRINITY_DN1605_c0_g1~~TRINITY_DN1605_c0_g1_i1.p1  ORF type:complete len:517 (+),score=85.43 TRINITY_DN1605_c0_g1_i1:118-1668(+)